MRINSSGNNVFGIFPLSDSALNNVEATERPLHSPAQHVEFYIQVSHIDVLFLAVAHLHVTSDLQVFVFQQDGLSNIFLLL